MNIIKKYNFILITTILIMQTAQAMQLINNKDINININGSIQSSDTYNINKKINDKIDSSITLILDGKSKTKNGISIFGKLQNNIDLNLKNINKKIDTQIAYIGIKHKNLGEINYGKNQENLNNTLSYTSDVLNKSKLLKDNNITGINNNFFTYKKEFKFNKNNPYIKNIIFISQYQGKNNIGNSIEDISKSSENRWGVTYNINTKYGIDLSTSYSKKEYDNRQTDNKFKEDKTGTAWTSGIKYNLNNIYLASTYTIGKNITPISIINDRINNSKYIYSKNSKNISIVAKYDFNFGLTPIFGYVQTTANNSNINKINHYEKKPSNIDIEKYFDIGTIYNFNKSLYGYIDYKIDQTNNINKNTNIYNKDDIFSLGFVYKF